MGKISVKAARINAGLTQVAIAKLLGVHVQTYLKFEQHPEKMTVKMANDFAKIVNQSVEAIYFLPSDSNLTRNSSISSGSYEN